MKPFAYVLAGTLAAGVVAIPTSAHADRVEVTRDKNCVWVVEPGGVVTDRYVLTRIVTTRYDETTGEQLGEPEKTKWKRWDRSDYREKWRRLCGPGSSVR